MLRFTGAPPQTVHWQPAMLMIAAAMGTAAILRPLIRKPGRRLPILTGLLATYLGAALYGWCFLAWDCLGSSEYADLGDLVSLSVFVFVPVGSVVVGTACIYWAGPAAIAACFLLRWINPAEPSEGRSQQAREG